MSDGRSPPNFDFEPYLTSIVNIFPPSFVKKWLSKIDRDSAVLPIKKRAFTAAEANFIFVLCKIKL